MGRVRRTIEEPRINYAAVWRLPLYLKVILCFRLLVRRESRVGLGGFQVVQG